MADLVHVRLGKGLKKKMEALIERGLYSNQAEMVREGLREVLRKYEKEFKRK